MEIIAGDLMANAWSKFMDAIQAGSTAFREAYLSADAGNDYYFASYEARTMRYKIYWSFFDNSAYRNIHTWSKKFKTDFGLYKYTRAIYNPAHRIGDFWQSHLWGGILDIGVDGAGDKGALPIVTDNAALRIAIARLYQDSNWQVNKDVTSLWGATMGDAVIKIVDNPEHKLVYMNVVHPSTLADVDRDARGNVKSYVISEVRTDPRNDDKTVTYTEIAERDGDNVVYRTYLNNDLFAWNDIGAEWTVPYGFIPMIVIQHDNVGLSYGWSELHAAMSKMRELDDQASKVSDHIRKYVDPAWLISGAAKPQATPTITNSTPTAGRPEPDREEMKILYSGPGTTLSPFVAPLDLPGALQHISNLLSSLEDDYPELRVEKLRLTGGMTGRAMQMAQQPAEAKVQKRRAGYDDSLKRAMQMAVAIGGWRGYEGYRGFNLDSYKAGNLEFEIGKRAVFALDRMDDLEQQKAMWDAAKAARDAAGTAGLAIFLRAQGISNEDIAAIEAELGAQSFATYP